jgi:alcohol dehydrogenase (cytochrome c)
MVDTLIRWRVKVGLRRAVLAGLGAGAAMAAAMIPMVAMAGAGDESEAAPEPGKTLFAVNCASCHGDQLRGGPFGPSLTGAAFQAKWTDADALFGFVSTKMPPANAGTLAPREYRAIVKFLVTSNKPSASVGVAGEAAEANASARSAGGSESLPKHEISRTAPPEIFGDETYRGTLESRKAQLDRMSPVTDAMLKAPSRADWLHWRRTYQQTGHSPLDQINRTTVAGLAAVWAWSLPVGANEISPIVHDGVIFVTSANEVQALDAAGGSLLWRYTRDLEAQYRTPIFSMQRNFAIYRQAIYVSTADRHVVALDAKTGKPLWDTAVVPADRRGPTLSTGPIAVDGKIIQGVSNGGSCRGGCFIVALDATSGRQLWRFNTVAQPHQLGGETWNNAPADQRFGGGIWVPPSYDPETGFIYFGTGGTYLTAPLLSSGEGRVPVDNDALYTDSTLALDPATGKLAWYHQHLARDVWDMDEALARVLVTLPIAGKQQRMVITTGKLGILDALNPANGAYLFSRDLGVQNLVASIDPKTGRRTIDPALRPTPGKTLHICPSSEGVLTWKAVAYNSSTMTMYFPMEEICMDFVWQPDAEAVDQSFAVDISWLNKPIADSDGKYGRIEALDLSTGKTKWLRRSRAPLSSSLLSTDGGLIFSVDRDRMFRELDDRTGKTLWEMRLNAVPSASPITYSVGGRQYVAISAGGGGPHDAQSWQMTPEIENSTASTTLWVFALPQPP